jgi:hypothetical protein
MQSKLFFINTSLTLQVINYIYNSRNVYIRLNSDIFFRISGFLLSLFLKAEIEEIFSSETSAKF